VAAAAKRMEATGTTTAAGLVVDRSVGMEGEAWIPDTAAFAALGRRSGMTKAVEPCLAGKACDGLRFAAARMQRS